MSVTSRDTSQAKDGSENTPITSATGRGERCCPIPPQEPSHNPANVGIVAALCRMAMLRTRSTTVNGAYQNEPVALLAMAEQLDR